MKLSTKLIESVIEEVAGKDVIPLVLSLRNKKNVSEFSIADTLALDINATRNMLYRLQSNNLVTFTRKKDTKKGWYIYYWTMNLAQLKTLFHDLKRKKLKTLKERLQREEGNDFFSCANRCLRLDFHNATEFEFKCPECGEMMHQMENSAFLDSLREDIKKLEIDLTG
ncbi:hypothetical protein HYW21_06030 [Candidatus Woesearchaeota archaeon]|nr:hypothetical protein [Candidatus Woesearchaeota archaeon]